MKSNENDVAFLFPSYPFPPSMDFSVQNHLSSVLLPSLLSSENQISWNLIILEQFNSYIYFGSAAGYLSILYIRSEVVNFFHVIKCLTISPFPMKITIWHTFDKGNIFPPPADHQATHLLFILVLPRLLAKKQSIAIYHWYGFY